MTILLLPYVVRSLSRITLSLNANVPMTTRCEKSKAFCMIFSSRNPPATCTGMLTDFAIFCINSKFEPNPSVASRSTKWSISAPADCHLLAISSGLSL